MSKIKKTTLPWVERMGSLATQELARTYQRVFTFHQGGPYTQDEHPHVAIHFHEPSFKSLPKLSPSDRYDDRFGFIIDKEYDELSSAWVLAAGFSLRNKVIARSRFVPNLSRAQGEVARRLWEWIRADPENSHLHFDQAGGGKYVFDPRCSFDDLLQGLSKYPDLDRKSSGIHGDKVAGYAGASFTAVQVIRRFVGMIDDQSLSDTAEEAVESALVVFAQLSFLYELLQPRPKLDTVSDLSIEDERTRVLASVVQRQGQADFRELLLRAYKCRCAISGCDVEAALQAAHIIPYAGPQSNHCWNGLLLRADLHNLFDLNLLTINPETLTVSLAPSLSGTWYGSLEGTPINVPDCPTERPSCEALKRKATYFQCST